MYKHTHSVKHVKSLYLRQRVYLVTVQLIVSVTIERTHNTTPKGNELWFDGRCTSLSEITLARESSRMPSNAQTPQTVAHHASFTCSSRRPIIGFKAVTARARWLAISSRPMRDVVAAARAASRTTALQR